ncbi:MAG: neutral zinc metallopeptidase [Methanotrichaceae archaeon]|nr:neutral zinc metallopeptidase [Methanotrichaceae archaeon]
MRRDGRRSENIEDRRGQGVRRGTIGGGIGLIIIVLVGMLLGADPSTILNMIAGGSGGLPSQSEMNRSGADAELVDFVSVVLGDTEDTWQDIFKQKHMVYKQPKLVLFSDGVDSACGFAQSAVGPFYCANDQKVYIDLSFYHDLKDQYGAPGDFAQAYVISHEVGHHVQNLLGDLEQVHRLESQTDEVTANKLSVMLELQADCYAGVWANHANKTRQIIETGDIEEALNAASKIGDDALQKQAQGYVVPDAFTHGSSAQRMKWFKAGLERGDFNSCDTFNSDTLN